VNLLERVGLDEELPTIVRTIGWGKLNDEPLLGSRSRAQWDTGYGGGYLGHHDWYAPLEQYVSYGADQAECVVEGIGRLERWMDDFATIQTKMQASIDSQTSMMHDLFGHFGINPDA
jgi:hypothetical protein